MAQEQTHFGMAMTLMVRHHITVTLNTGVYQLSANDTVGIYSEISQSVTINGNASMTYSNFCGFLVG